MRFAPLVIVGAALLLRFATASAAQMGSARLVPPPDLAERVGFDQRIGAAVPDDLSFMDAEGRPTTLAESMHGRPLVLALGYYRCPNLCGTTLRGIANAIYRIDLVPGRDVEVAFVSIDPHETPSSAMNERRSLMVDVPAAAVDRWHLLTGSELSIARLAKAIGFRYFLDRRNDEYAHAAGLVVLTPGGRVAQYFFGVDFPPHSLRLSLIDASDGRLGTAIDRFVLFCCSYDPSTGRYSLLIGRVMAIIGCLFALGFALWLWRFGWRRHR